METSVATASSHNSSTQTEKPGFLINRNFRLLALGQGVSQFGDFVLYMTLSVWIAAKVGAGQSWAPLAFGATMIASQIPSLVIGPWAGVFVDRWQHRRTMIIMDVLRACIIASMILFTGVIPLPWQLPPLAIMGLVCAVNMLESTCAQFFNPATNGLIGQIVPQEQQPQAEGFSQAINASAKLIGPMIGPALYFSVGIFWCLVIDILSFLVSVVSIWAVKASHIERPASEQQKFWNDFIEGVKYAFQDRVLRVLMISLFILTLGSGALDSLMIFFIQDNLHANLSYSGILVSAVGLGSIVGALLLGKYANRIGLVRLLWASLLGAGLILMLFSRLTNFPLAVLVILIGGVAIAGLNVAIGPLLLRQAPPELIGRVSSTLGTFSTVGLIVSVLFAGYLASVVLVSLHIQALGMTFGPLDTIYLFSGLIFALSGLYVLFALRNVSLRNVAAAEAEPA